MTRSFHVRALKASSTGGGPRVEPHRLEYRCLSRTPFHGTENTLCKTATSLMSERSHPVISLMTVIIRQSSARAKRRGGESDREETNFLQHYSAQRIKQSVSRQTLTEPIPTRPIAPGLGGSPISRLADPSIPISSTKCGGSREVRSLSSRPGMDLFYD